jgi:Ca2+-binding RTX toxin-like protein
MTGGPGNDNLNGGKGTDISNHSDGSSSIVGKLFENKVKPDGHGNEDTLTDMEGINGSPFDDQIFGDGNANILSGNGGDDTIRGLAGDDQLRGGFGNDRLDGEDGNDNVNGDQGDDLVLGGPGNDVLTGASGDDKIYGEQGQDQLTGGSGSDILDGGLDLDVLEGGGGGPADLVTDYLFMNYDRGKGHVEDLYAVAGAAFGDEFSVSRIEFDNKIPPGGKPGDEDPFEPQQKYAGQMTSTERLDAQYEMKYPVGSPQDNLVGIRTLFFTDFDGGDGSGGDLLNFPNS